MIKMNKKILFLLVFCEGYVVLASELIAIRQLIPFIGTGTEVISIIIGAVLLSMALGYHYGGIARTDKIRQTLIKNFLSSQFILTLGLSYITINIFYELCNFLGLKSKIAFCFLYSLLFLVIPIFKLAQTIPLVSNYFYKHKSSKITSNILFFSTLGSFLGSIFSTLILMQYFGVNYALIFTLFNFVIMMVSIFKKQFYYELSVAILLFIFGYFLNGSDMMKASNLVETNQYSNIAIKELPEIQGKILSINNSLSSLYAPNLNDRFEYIQYIEKDFIRKKENKTRKILVIGAGGFVLGYEDDVNDYDYVDIDKSLKSISEKYILPKKIGENKNFIQDSALAYLKNCNKKYDLIIVDAFSNLMNIPLEVTVVEFWQEVKKHLNKDAKLVANIIASKNFNDRYSVRIDNSFRAVFQNYNRQVITSSNSNVSDNEKYHNIIYSYSNNNFVNDRTIYNLNHSSYSIDK
ncbi:MAG: fused MFS/spermidine synthase [Alphaproteobacteria bacterium]